MKTTGNLGLKKPDGTDIVDITDLNGNMDILDTAVKAVQDHAADAVKHITAAERTAWNTKASTTAATASAAGLMAAADKAKLDGVAAGANNYVHPNHTGDVTSSGDGVTAIAAGVIVNADVNATAAIDASKIGTGVVSNAEFAALDGVIGNVQAQIDNRAQLSGNNTFTNVQKITSTTGTNTAPALSIEGSTFNAALQIKNTTATTGKRYSLYSYNGGDFAIANETDAYTIAQVDGASKIWTFPAGVKAPNVPNQTSADITYYVRTDGNDSNTGLGNTAGGAFRTITKALTIVPKNVRHTVIIYVAAGTYNEGINVQGFYGEGVLSINGATAATSTHIVTNVASVRNACRVQVAGFKTTTTTTSAFYVINSLETIFDLCYTDTSTTQFAFYAESAKVYLHNCVIIGRTGVSAVYAHVNGEIFVQDCSGTANNVGHYAAYKGHIHITGTFIGSALKMNTSEGGIVTDGYGVVNPWGDNTTLSRSSVSAYASGTQSFSAGVSTKMLYQTINLDNLSEFSANSRFTAKKGGRYLVQGSSVIYNPSGSSAVSIAIYVNGGAAANLQSGVIQNGANWVIGGTVPLKLNAGDYVEIYVFSAAATSTGFGGLFNVDQIA